MFCSTIVLSQALESCEATTSNVRCSNLSLDGMFVNANIGTVNYSLILIRHKLKSLATVVVFSIFLFILSDFRFILLKLIFRHRTSVDVKPGMISSNQTWFAVNGDKISENGYK